MWIVYFPECKTKCVLKFCASICEDFLYLSKKCQQFIDRTQHAVALWVLIGGLYNSFRSTVQCHATCWRGLEMWTVCLIGVGKCSVLVDNCVGKTGIVVQREGYVFVEGMWVKGTRKEQGFTNIKFNQNLAVALIADISKNWNGK